MATSASQIQFQTQTAIIPENPTQTAQQSTNQTQTIPETQQNPPQTNSSLAISGGQAASNISDLSSSNNISNIGNLPQQPQQPNSAANAAESNSEGSENPQLLYGNVQITGNAIDEIIPETDLSSILEPSTNASTSNNSVPLPQLTNNNSTSGAITQNNIAASATEETSAEDDDSKEIKQKIEKLSKIRHDVKGKSMSVKQAKEQLKLEQLKDINLDEIESEEDAAYAAKPSKEKAMRSRRRNCLT